MFGGCYGVVFAASGSCFGNLKVAFGLSRRSDMKLKAVENELEGWRIVAKEVRAIGTMRHLKRAPSLPLHACTLYVYKLVTI